MNILKLDVGCGAVGSGDVNCDLYVNDAGHRLTGNAINPRRMKNFVCCDAQHLPFRDEAFDWVYSSHAIEHVNDPFAMLREMVRVARIRVTIRCPHRLGEKFFLNRNPYHVNFFSATWFKKAFRKFNCISNVDVINYRPFPHRYIALLRLPYEMQIDAFKSSYPETSEIIHKLGVERAYEILRSFLVQSRGKSCKEGEFLH